MLAHGMGEGLPPAQVAYHFVEDFPEGTVGGLQSEKVERIDYGGAGLRITSYNVCYTKLLRQ